MNYTYQKGLKISKLSLGTVQLGLNYGINNTNGMPDEQVSHEILKTALDKDVTVIDTASSYGNSERVIGDFLKGNTQYTPTVVTKFVINKNKGEMIAPGKVEAILRGEVEHSLENLNLKKIPILMLHRENEMFDYGNVLPDLLKDLKNEGLIERVGVSLNSHKYVDYIADSELYEAVQFPLNMMDTELIKKGGIEKLKKADKIVFVRSVFLQGLFFKDPEDLPSGILQNAVQPLRSIRKVAQETGISIAQLAVSFIRDIDGVSSLVLGCETPDQVMQNLELIHAQPISMEIRNKIMSMFDDIDPRIIMPWTWND